jgi:hypothetical protein
MFLEGGDQGRGQQQAGRGQGRKGVFGHLINMCVFCNPSLVFSCLMLRAEGGGEKS